MKKDTYWTFSILILLSLSVVPSIFALPDEVEFGIVFETVIGQGVRPFTFILLDPEKDDEIFGEYKAANANLTLSDITGGIAETLFVDSEGETMGRVLISYDIIEKPHDELWGLEGLATVVDLRPDRSDFIKLYDVKGIANLRDNTLMFEGKFDE